MGGSLPFRLSDLQGLGRMAADVAVDVTNVVEATHSAISLPVWLLGVPPRQRTIGITGLVYRCVRGGTRLVAAGVDAVLVPIVSLLAESRSTPEREAILASLNGIWGDYLAATSNPLAIHMSLRLAGQALILEKQALQAAMPQAGSRLLVLVHGLCRNDLQWQRQGHDHGEALARDLGYSPLYLHYNSGLHVSANGRAFASLLETLLREWPLPVKDLVIMGHSMGGLVARSACYYGQQAGHAWPRLLSRLMFLGTPHHGSPHERLGNWVDTALGATPFTAPFAQLSKRRSAGITDLRYGNLVDEDWQGLDRFAPVPDARRPVPLPPGVRAYVLAASQGKRRGDLKDRVLGDGLVLVDSALGRHRDSARALALPQSQQWIGYEMSHIDLLSRPEVYEQIKTWLTFLLPGV